MFTMMQAAYVTDMIAHFFLEKSTNYSSIYIEHSPKVYVMRVV